jgi:hypothetical protein
MMMRWVLALGLVAAISGQAYATDYIFNCRNFWGQSVLVRVTADTEMAARKKVKTEKAISDKYSLDTQSQCVYRSHIKETPKAKSPEKKQESVSTSPEAE